MKIIMAKRALRAIYAILFIAIAAVAVFSLISYYHEYQETRINRSNALQVTTAVQNENMSAAAPDFFAEYRLEREKIRSEQSDLLREMIKNAKTDEVRQHAQDSMLKLVLDKQRESEIESLIKAKGFNDSLVFIRDNSVNAIVKTNSLTKEEVIGVAEVIKRISGVQAENITISAKP